MTTATANNTSINLLSKSRAAGISDKKDADTILSINHMRTWSPWTLAARV